MLKLQMEQHTLK